MRVDFNVPIENGRVRDDWRLLRTLPTIRLLTERGARLVLITHLGRPGGRRVASYSVEPLAKRLTELLGHRVAFAADCVGSSATRAVANVRDGEVLLLENLRFHADEEKNDRTFARALADHGDLYVNDAFAAAHRAHASTVGITSYLPSYAGCLLEDEVTHLEAALKKPKGPVTVLIGGAKIDTKIGVMKALLEIADTLCVGGALAIPMLAASGRSVGASVVRPAERTIAKSLLKKKALVLPVDVVVATSKSAAARACSVDEVRPRDIIFDIGPETIRLYAKHIRDARTIVWNGPMGLMERLAFAHGTRALARHIGARATGRAYAVVGGGETVEAVRAVRMDEYIDWVSTGGGAMLEFMEQGTLPALVPLTKK